MTTADATSSSLSPRTQQLATRCLRRCGYLPDLVRSDYPVSENVSGVVAFAHQPTDARSSCVLVLPASFADEASIVGCRDIATPVVFVASDQRWDLWKQTHAEPVFLQSIRVAELEPFFAERAKEFAPSSIFRAKTWLRAGIGRQLDFVDVGLLPLVEQEAGARVVQLFEEMIATTMDLIGWTQVPDSNSESHWLTQTNFWLLAAKLLHDKRVEGFIRLDLRDIDVVFDRVSRHYNRKAPAQPPLRGRTNALRHVAEILERCSSFRNFSVETLGSLYEEALISPAVRKLLGTHRTPTYLVDYMLARLSPLIENLGAEECTVFEPACGHAPFLCGALRLLNDLLPPAIAKHEERRHDFLTARIAGCDRDAFALDIARLSLTLADIPHSNGWGLVHGDMFALGHLTNGVQAASVVLANPPFEEAQAAKFLRRTVAALRPGAIFGFVLPASELVGSASKDARSEILRHCDIEEISVFPDSMFRFASTETGIVLGQKRKTSRTDTARFLFRRVREGDMQEFRSHYASSWENDVDTEWVEKHNGTRFIIPELSDLWEACGGLPRLSQFVDVGQGLIHRSVTDPRFPKGAVVAARSATKGLTRGFASVDDAPDTHLLPTETWLNLSRSVIRRPVAGTTTGIPQLLLNYAPVDRGPWRLKAFIDAVGKPVTSRWLTLRVNNALPAISLESLWALCNSPVANAYAYAFGTKRDITAGLMRDMPVPNFMECDLSHLHVAALIYLQSAREIAPTGSSKKRAPQTREADARQISLFPSRSSLQKRSDGRDHLRALHWRVDAEVLKLYRLPPSIERSLLNLFEGIRRVGVPFEQLRYLPTRSEAPQTLDDFLRITDEWSKHEERRSELIDQKFDGKLTEPEARELRELRRLFTLRRRVVTPFRLVEARIGEMEDKITVADS